LLGAFVNSSLVVSFVLGVLVIVVATLLIKRKRAKKLWLAALIPLSLVSGLFVYLALHNVPKEYLVNTPCPKGFVLASDCGCSKKEQQPQGDLE
jgi:archaellum biogenesis protein FlaJ (TadC family)